ncbi:MAG: S8 family serine peptidase [Clostridiales bacterium]|nr:S8 family serine peptidase [Clostridiales bacterium]
MKKLLAVFTAFCICIGSIGICASAISASLDGKQKTTLFVQFDGDPVLMGEAKGLSEGSALKQTQRTQKKAMQSVENAVDNTKVLYTYTHALSGIAIEATKRDAAVLRDIPGVAKVVELTGVHPSVEKVAEGEPLASGSMIGVDKMYELGYDGTGTAVAVIDGGMQWDHESMRLTDESKAKFTKDDIAKVISSTTLHAEGVTADDAYKSAKVPFAFDYTDGDTEINQDSEHGTHVSGIAAGNSASLQGIAPEAQVLMFRIDVYDDQTFLATLLAAIDDAAKFDIASMNMSVGMDFEMPNNPAHKLLCEAIDNARSSGILVCAAAGNSYVFSEETLHPDNGTNGVPNAIPSATSVASIDNMYMQRGIYTVDKFIYDGDKSVKALDAVNSFPSEGELVPVNRKARSADLDGKIALVYDAATSVDQYYKKLSGKSMKGMIVSESLYMLAAEFSWNEGLPVAVVSDVDAYRLLHSKSKHIKAEYKYYYVQPADKLQNSYFSSYGVSDDLKLTVDLAAPGDPILSSVPGDSYSIMGGTSMACPHVTGAAALMRQHLDKTYPELSASDRADLMENILMSTADPVSLVSPRVLGAGLVDLGDASKAKAVLTDSDGHTALNIGDGIGDSFKLSFTVSNVSAETVRYDNLSIDVITDDYTTEKIFDETTGVTTEKNLINGKSVPLTYSVTQSDMPRSIVLEPGEEKTVTMTVKLDSDELEENEAVFSNGFYIEGYIHLKDLSGKEVKLNIPFMGFYGDWLKSPSIEKLIDYDMEFYYVFRNLRSLTIELIDENGKAVAETKQEWVKKSTYYYVEDLIYLFDGETVPDGVYTVRFTSVLDADAPGQVPQVLETEDTFIFDSKTPNILDVSSKKQSDGTYTLSITVDSDDVSYFELVGRSLFVVNYYDIYPIDSNPQRNDDGSFVYEISGVRLHDRSLIIYAYDAAKNSSRYHQYTPLMLLLNAMSDAFADLLDRVDTIFFEIIYRIINIF